MIKKSLLFVVFVSAVGALAFRLYPFFAGLPWLSEFFVTEDGYLMLTVARNMATGLGMSVSEGTIATNGVQPMATFAFALAYWLVDGDKVAGLAGVTAISALWSIGGFVSVWAWARQALSPRLADPVWPWVVAALWFSGPLMLRHTMNALETGLYIPFVLLALLWFLRILRQEGEGGIAERLGFGGFCGLVFLARNDGALLIMAIFVSWALYDLAVRRRSVMATALRLIPPGLATLVVAGPWMVYNKLVFGSIVPISGWAQQLSAGFGQNLPLLPVALFEHAFPMLPIPGSMEGNAMVIAICLVALLVVCALYLTEVLRMEPAVRFMLLAYTLFVLMLCGYYGLNFGAPHFISRYMAPASPLLITAGLSALTVVVQRLVPRFAVPAVAALSIGGLFLSGALLARQLMPGWYHQGHFQVVRWVDANIDDTEWVGAVQTGTLGYWHDRTINLDGKVNPEALAALHKEGHVLNYVISSKINYIADWHGVAGWARNTETDFPDHFGLIVADPVANLAVLSRKDVR